MIAIMINFKYIQQTIEFIQHIIEEVPTNTVIMCCVLPGHQSKLLSIHSHCALIIHTDSYWWQY